MTNEEQLLERMDRLEAQIAPLAQSAKAVGELRQELAPRVNEAVHYLIAELADVEADFNQEDLLRLIKNAMRNVNNLNFALDQMKNLIDFAVVAEPLLKDTVPQVILYLDDLEQKGVLRLLNHGLEVIKKIASNYSQEDLDQIGDGLVRMADILKAVTTPQALDVLESAAKIPAEANFAGAKPTGAFGLMGAMGNKQVRQGLGVMLELTKAAANIGRSSEAATDNG